MGRIVVGLEGSEGSRAALRWALRQAALRGDRVEVVTAYTYPNAPIYPEVGYVPAEQPGLVEQIVDLQEQAISEETAHTGVEVEVTRTILPGPAPGTLVKVAEGADLLVVGSRGRGGFLGLMLGSVSNYVTHHSPCPVLVVRGQCAQATKA